MAESANLVESMDKSRFVIALIDEEKYIDKITEIAKSVKNAEKICYVCLSKPYTDICEDLKMRGADIKKFYFVDTLSSHYGINASSVNCTFVDSPTNIPGIKDAITKASKEKKCTSIVFDTISAMLIYQDNSKIVRFTHDFLSEKHEERSRILYLVIRHDSVPAEENEKLVSDLSMFADKTIKVK